MTKFELYLEKCGYVRHEYNHKTKLFTVTEKHVLSSMGTLAYYYIHPCDIKQEKAICIGLNEANKPATLINPRPNIGRTHREVGMNKVSDNEIIKVLEKVDFQIIMKLMFSNKLVFIENNGGYEVIDYVEPIYTYKNGIKYIKQV